MPDGAPLPISRCGKRGFLLETCRRLPGLGVWAAKLQRLQRRDFLETIKGPAKAAHVRRVLEHPAGREFQAAMMEWLRMGGQVSTEASRDLFPVPDRMDGKQPRCSVIINTVDRARDLAITLGALRSHWDAGKDELIIVLGPSADASRQVLRDCPLKHRLVDCPEKNLGLSRNLGLKEAAGRYVAYLDDDASPEPGWLDALLAPLEEDDGTAVAAGFILDGEGGRFLNRYVVADTLGRAWWFDDEATAQEKIGQLGKQRAFLTASGCNMAFRRDALAVIGGFDEHYRYFLEETDVVRRLMSKGWQCRPAPQSRVRHRLGSNVARKPGFAMEDRLVLIRSQIHFIRKFGRAAFGDEDMVDSLWERVLRDLEKIAWDCVDHAASGVSGAEIQGDYLRTLAADLRKCGGLT